jgi:hypothetical protein
MSEEKVEKKVKKEDKNEARLGYLERTVARIKNELETKLGYDVDGDGRIGSIGMKLLVCVASFCIVFSVGSIAIADNIDSKSLGTGTYSLDRASVNTGLITLTVDAVVADITGDITVDDINASGANTATLDVNLGADTNVTMSTVTYKQSTPAISIEDGDKRVAKMLNAFNDATQAVDYVDIEYVIDDASDTSEDASVVIKIMKAGSATTVYTLNASGLTIVGAVDCDNVTVNAGAGIDNASAGTLLIGAATATKVEVGLTAVETEIQGTLDCVEGVTFQSAIFNAGSLPTATNGLAAGRVWLNSNVLTITP